MTRGTLLLIFIIGSLHRSAPQNCSYPLSQYRDQFNSVSPSGNLEAFTKESIVILRDQPFNCSGTITGVTIRVNEYDLRPGETQGIYVYFILISGEEKNNVKSVRGFAVNDDMLTRVAAGSFWYTTLERAFSPVKVEGGDIVGIYIPQDGFDGVTFIQPLSILNSETALMVYGQYVNMTSSSNDISDVLENVLVNEDITSSTVAVHAPLIQFTFAATDATPSSAIPSSASGGPDLILIVVAPVVVVLAVILFIIVVAILFVILYVVCFRKKDHTADGEMVSPKSPVSATNHIRTSPPGSEERRNPSPTYDPGPGYEAIPIIKPQAPPPVSDHKSVPAFPEHVEVDYALPNNLKNKSKDESQLQNGYDDVILFVPTIDMRITLESEGHYSLPDLQTQVYAPSGSQHYTFPSTESEIYWKPASTEEGLYSQLSEHKYHEIPKNSIITGVQIGEGEFGTVYKGEWQSLSGSVLDVAIKRLRSCDEKVKFLQEAATMGQFHHPHVVKLHGVVTLSNPIMMVMELLEKGDLRSYLLNVDFKSTSNLSSLLLQFCHHISEGMAHLASKDFIHRDLAARNILLDGNLNCKIADFGMSRDVSNNYYLSKGGRIPLKWTSPEGVLFQRYTTASDVWSYGMVLFEIWSLGKKPFEDLTPDDVVQLFTDHEGYCQPPPTGCPRGMYQLMVRCWHPDYHYRPTFQDIVDLIVQGPADLSEPPPQSDMLPSEATILGQELKFSKELYKKLQKTYLN